MGRNLRQIAYPLIFSIMATQSHSTELRDVQAALQDLGYAPGPVDGQYGRRTRDALERFFERTNVVFEGTLNDDLAQFVVDFRNYANTPREILAGLVTQTTKPSDLDDEMLCSTLRVLPLNVTFREAEVRNLDCDLSVNLDLNLPRRYGGLDEIETYASSNNITVPDFDLTNVEPVFPDLEETRTAFNSYNVGFGRVFHEAVRTRDIDFCRSWLPTVRHVMPNPSKNLDGTGSWQETTLRDAQVFCQDRLTTLALAALSDGSEGEWALRDYQAMVDTWIRNDAPVNLMYDNEGVSTNFPYILMINQITSGVEMLRAGFDWGPEQDQAYAEWARRRVDDIHPYEISNPVGSEFCHRPIRGGSMSDECMNAAALTAQVTMRVGILTQSPELIRRAYLTFHRYMAAIRPDGSPAFDSLRGCYAADYVAWAAMFSDAFLFQWDRIAEIDWTLRVNEGGSIKEMMEYALSVVETPSLVNQYADNEEFNFLHECYDGSGNMVQNESEDPIEFFATYLGAHDPDRLRAGIGSYRNTWSFSRGGGPNYETAVLKALSN